MPTVWEEILQKEERNLPLLQIRPKKRELSKYVRPKHEFYKRLFLQLQLWYPALLLAFLSPFCAFLRVFLFYSILKHCPLARMRLTLPVYHFNSWVSHFQNVPIALKRLQGKVTGMQ